MDEYGLLFPSSLLSSPLFSLDVYHHTWANTSTALCILRLLGNLHWHTVAVSWPGFSLSPSLTLYRLWKIHWNCKFMLCHAFVSSLYCISNLSVTLHHHDPRVCKAQVLLSFFPSPWIMSYSIPSLISPEEVVSPYCHILSSVFSEWVWQLKVLFSPPTAKTGAIICLWKCTAEIDLICDIMVL